MNEPDNSTFNRRRFFGRVGTLFTAAAAAVLARPQPQAPAGDRANTPGPAPKQGYRKTEHVRKYYHKARF